MEIAVGSYMKKALYAILFILVGAPSVLLAGQAERDRIHEVSMAGLNLKERGISIRASFGAGSAATALTNDVKVSESAAPAMFHQDNVNLTVLRDGSWLAVWQDERLGSDKIFLQRLDSLGTPVGSNQMIAGSSVGANYAEPKVAVDTSGRIYLYYRDRTNGLVYGSRFSSTLSVDLAAFLVNDTSSGAFAGPFDFDVYPDGRTVVVWENYSTVGSTIAFCIFSSTGSRTVVPTVVNTDGGSVNHWVPKVAIQPGGGFLIAWEDYRYSQADIMARLYFGSGTAVATEFAIVPPGPESYAQYAPAVVYSSIDGYYVAWIDARSGQEVYGQIYNPTTGAVGSNVLISAGDVLTTNWDVSLAVSPQGRLTAVWGSYGPQNSILSRRFLSGLVPVVASETKNMATVGRRWAPSVRFRSANRYGVAWTEYASNDPNINFMLFDTTNARLLTSECRLNADSTGAPTSQPMVVNTLPYNNVIAYASRRNDDGDIYVRLVSHAGVLVTSSVRVNQDVGYTLQSEPWVAASGSGILVTWVDSRAIGGSAGQRIFGRYGTLAGQFSSSEFAISDTTQSAAKSNPRAIMTQTGRGLVVWLDQRTDTAQVYGRWLTTAGQLDGSEFLISTPASDVRNIDLQVGVDSLDRFYVVWLDAGATPATVKGKWYNANKSLGGSFSYSSTVSGVSMNEMSAAINDSGQVALLWTGSDATTRRLYVTVISRTGAVAVPAYEASDNVSAFPSEPKLSCDPDRYLSAVWVDHRDGKRRVYYQMISNMQTLVGGNQPVSSSDVEFMEEPATQAMHGRAWFVWVDPRQDGANIFGNVIVYDVTDVDDGSHTVPGSYVLGQNYPNPFNPSTEISFSLPARSVATLTVYNLLGEQVRRLVNGTVNAGEHRVTWDGCNDHGTRVASGVYLYRLEAGEFAQTKKMVLLK